MLLPSKHSVKKGEEVTFTYQWGHPFEHQLFDAPAPEALVVVGPDGKKTDLLDSLRKTTVPGDEGKKVTAYQFTFAPPDRGDYVFVLRTPPIWMEEDGEFLQDSVKVVLHVQAQNGWDHWTDEYPSFGPLTRPYGLQAGMVYQAILSERPGASKSSFVRVEVERYNPRPPKELPPDEQITRVVTTDREGVCTANLTDPGWWCLASAGRKKGEREHNGKKYPLRERAILWVYVDEKPTK
jgi:cobalt/nickel transport protein